MPQKKYYRIGDLSKKLGVTPDLLKYCEQKGLITSRQKPNGYRYYDFAQSATVYEYLKLRNQGYTAEQIVDVLHAGSFQEYVRMATAHEKSLERQIRFWQALLAYTRELQDEQDMFTGKPGWYLKRGAEMYFLPHSEKDRLYDSDKCLKQVAEWIEWMPIVCSAYSVGADAEQGAQNWGLAVDAEFARAQELDLSAPAQLVPAGLCLELYLSSDLADDASLERISDCGDVLRELGLRQTGDALHLVLAKIWVGEQRKGYSRIRIPVERV